MTMMKSASIPEMITQSREVMTSPSVPTFERYERHGTVANAAMYVGIAAIIAGLLGLGSGVGGVITGFLSALAQFFVFTGLVYFLGKKMYDGTGTWDEVAYTFSLFTAPLIIIGALIGLVITLFAWVPLINILVAFVGLIVGLALLLVQVYYAYIAVQSSMNLVNQSQALITLVLSSVGTFIVMLLVAAIF
ncbi:MAG: DUF1282 domain-containing protein [Candidatus Viridilinea halotolerans]|uniref:DUF1282 domain-containing protein n=1 Tax=Candidatus Viridilinea halotolerans TaxID=2491704 RepID=A0A426U8W8_9CHLR|nr:MAG: DUF1282 domain-containing protein [Candidatus Viridilinea halotolerans]